MSGPGQKGGGKWAAIDGEMGKGLTCQASSRRKLEALASEKNGMDSGPERTALRNSKGEVLHGFSMGCAAAEHGQWIQRIDFASNSRNWPRTANIVDDEQVEYKLAQQQQATQRPCALGIGQQRDRKRE